MFGQRNYDAFGTPITARITITFMFRSYLSPINLAKITNTYNTNIYSEVLVLDSIKPFIKCI